MFLYDYFWQILASVLSILAILVSIFIYTRQRQTKSITWQNISTTALLSINPDLKDKVKILVNSQPLTQVHLILIKIINTGNSPILESDYDQPLSIEFGKAAKIITTDITDASDASLKTVAKVTIMGQTIVLNPVLLNNRDWITVRTLVDEYDGPLNVKGRIIGVKSITPFVASKPFIPAPFSTYLFFWILGVATILFLLNIQLIIQSNLQVNNQPRPTPQPVIWSTNLEANHKYPNSFLMSVYHPPFNSQIYTFIMAENGKYYPQIVAEYGRCSGSARSTDYISETESIVHVNLNHPEEPNRHYKVLIVVFDKNEDEAKFLLDLVNVCKSKTDIEFNSLPDRSIIKWQADIISE